MHVCVCVCVWVCVVAEVLFGGKGQEEAALAGAED